MVPARPKCLIFASFVNTYSKAKRKRQREKTKLSETGQMTKRSEKLILWSLWSTWVIFREKFTVLLQPLLQNQTCSRRMVKWINKGTHYAEALKNAANADFRDANCVQKTSTLPVKNYKRFEVWSKRDRTWIISTKLSKTFASLGFAYASDFPFLVYKMQFPFIRVIDDCGSPCHPKCSTTVADNSQSSVLFLRFVARVSDGSFES